MADNQFEINVNPEWIKKYLVKILIGLACSDHLVFTAIKDRWARGRRSGHPIGRI
jgi:hypothetical protein